MYRFLLKDKRGLPSSRRRLFAERKKLVEKLRNRSQFEKQLVDDVMLLGFLVLVGIIFGIELTANLLNFHGWASWAHLIVVGCLQLAVLHLLVAAARGGLNRLKLRYLDSALRADACLPSLETASRKAMTGKQMNPLSKRNPL